MPQPVKAVLLNDTSANDHHGCRVVVRQIRDLCGRHDIDLWHAVKLGEDWETSSHLERLEASQLVIVNGEGTMHSDKRNAFRLARVADFCKAKGIPSALINSVYQNNGPELSKHVSNFDRVFMRESESQKALGAHGIEAGVAPDMTLSFPQPRPSGKDRRGILFTDSASPESTEQSFQLAKLLDGATLINLKDREPGFVSKLIGSAFRQDASTKAKKKKKKSKKGEASVSFNAVPGQALPALLSRLQSAELVVTGRYHMVCFALLTQTPFVALPSNTFKTQGLLKDAKLVDRMLDTDDVSDLSKAAWQNGELERANSYVAGAAAAIDQMFSEIRALCRAP